jgi:hypothetical protein
MRKNDVEEKTRGAVHKTNPFYHYTLGSMPTYKLDALLKEGI